MIHSFARVALARKWHHVALVVWATLPVLALLGTVTLTHWRRFNRDSLPFSVWLVAYVFLPPVLALLLALNRRRDPRVPDFADAIIPPWIRAATAVIGIAFAALGAGLLLAPDFMATIWPWPIKPLASRARGRSSISRVRSRGCLWVLS